MDTNSLIEYLLNNRDSLGEKVLNAPERWFFSKENLPEEICSMIRPEHIGIYLTQTPNLHEWNVLL